MQNQPSDKEKDRYFRLLYPLWPLGSSDLSSSQFPYLMELIAQSARPMLRAGIEQFQEPLSDGNGRASIVGQDWASLPCFPIGVLK